MSAPGKGATSAFDPLRKFDHILSLAMGKRRRWLWALACAALLPIALWITQCTPVAGCWGDRTYAEGQHLGFTIGMNRQSAADSVQASYDVAGLSVWNGDNDIVFIKRLDELKAVPARQFEEWRFGGRRRPHCEWERDVVLVFRNERLLTIKDEVSITLP
jgi:hypothetical protein